MGEKRESVGANEKGLDQACHWSQQDEMTAPCTEVVSTRDHRQPCNHNAGEWGEETSVLAPFQSCTKTNNHVTEMTVND